MQPNPYSHGSPAPAVPSGTVGYEFADGPGANAAVEGASLIAFLTQKKDWRGEKIRQLGNYLIQQCGSSAAEKGRSIFDEVRELSISFFASILKTESTTLLESPTADYSFSGTLGIGMNAVDFAGKLNKKQALCISRSLLGNTRTRILESDHSESSEFSYAVINAICQTKGFYNYSIKDFLDQLKPKSSLT